MMPLRMLGLLMLMLVQCGARRCPDDLLVVTSSEVIAEFHSNILLNCSIEENNHDGISWIIGNTTLSEEEDQAYVEFNWTVSDWDVRPQCKIELNETFTCTEDLEITVYKNPESVDMYPLSHGDKVVEGTLYELQCDFTEVAPIQKLRVKWYKDNNFIQEADFNSTIKTPVSESDMLIVNISRKDNGTQFRCEAQLDFGPDGVKRLASSEQLKVYVHYPPALNNTPLLFLKEEGDNVTLICDAEGYPAPKFHWTNNGVNMTEDTNSLFVNSLDEDTVYTCTAYNYVGKITKEFHVNVTKNAVPTPTAKALPEESPLEGCPLTLTPTELVVKLGDPASVNCSTSVADPARLGWETPKGGIGTEGLTIITWSVDKVEFWDKEPMCYITTRHNGQCHVPLALTVYKTPEIITHFPPSLVEEGKESVLKCDFINVAPVQNLRVQWYRGNESLKTETFGDKDVRPVNRSSTLRVVHKRGHNGEKIICTAELHLGPNGPHLIPTVTSEPYVANINYKPKVKNCQHAVSAKEHSLAVDSLHCEADGNPPPKVQWFHQGELLNLSQPLNRSHSGRYRVEFSNYLGNTTDYVDITVEYRPSFTCAGYYEVKENDQFKISCKPEGNPEPHVTWFKDGKKFSRRHWMKHDGGKYLLEARNSYGTEEHKVEIEVMYAPEFNETNSDKQVLVPGENVTLECSAEGKPAPMIRWSYPHAENVKETTRGSHEIVSITGATLVNTGVYICVATNKVGNFSRSVTVVVTGSTSGGWKFPWWLWVLIALIIIFIIICWCWRKHHKTRGQYNFIPDKSKDEIPMSNQTAA